jgi:hypothetical protein
MTHHLPDGDGPVDLDSRGKPQPAAVGVSCGYCTNLATGPNGLTPPLGLTFAEVDELTAA